MTRSITMLLLLLFVAAAPTVAPRGPAFSAPLQFTNELMPFEPGGMKVFMGRSEGKLITLVELYREGTRSFDLHGVTVETCILQETQFEAGQLVELSLNYFAQADNGTVYYFGEVVNTYENGETIGHEGSWLVGGPQESDPAGTYSAHMPTVFMPRDPQIGDSWKPDDLYPFVDETVTVIDTEGRMKVPAGKFEGVMTVEETSEVDLDKPERKWYAPEQGLVKTKTKGESLKLVSSSF